MKTNAWGFELARQWKRRWLNHPALDYLAPPSCGGWKCPVRCRTHLRGRSGISARLVPDALHRACGAAWCVDNGGNDSLGNDAGPKAQACGRSCGT